MEVEGEAPTAVNRYREWQQKQYARLKTAWDLSNNVIWIGEEDTAEYTARIVCSAWLSEMLLWDPDPSIKHVSIFTETMRDAHLVNMAVSESVVAVPGVVLLQKNKECLWIQRCGIERLASFVPISRHTTRGTSGDRIIVLVREEGIPSKDTAPCPFAEQLPPPPPPQSNYTRLCKDVIFPILEMTNAKIVTYGIPKLRR